MLIQLRVLSEHMREKTREQSLSHVFYLTLVKEIFQQLLLIVKYCTEQEKNISFASLSSTSLRRHNSGFMALPPGWWTAQHPIYQSEASLWIGVQCRALQLWRLLTCPQPEDGEDNHLLSPALSVKAQRWEQKRNANSYEGSHYKYCQKVFASLLYFLIFSLLLLF